MIQLLDLPRLTDGHLLRAGAPIDEGVGRDFVAERLLAPLERAFAGPSVRPQMVITGRFAEATWRATSGHLLGRFIAPLFGIPPTGRLAWLRFGMFERLEGKAVAETLLLFDLPSLMLQAGVWPLAPSLGPDLMAPVPRARDGEAGESLVLVEAMIGGLMRYDGRDLRSMNMRAYWHEDFCWYGPAPIGSFCGHADYERGHQGPFLAAFPDRRGGNHRARIAENNLVASTGWPSITATHSGGDWLGLPATGKRVTMRVMDFWASRAGLLDENWVMIDLIDLLRQLDVDVFARMKNLTDRS